MEKKGNVYEGTDPDAVPSDEATMMRDAPYFAHTTYDRDNPDIKAGSTFADKNAFMLVIKQYAIKREFQTFVEHSDKSRYRARCADSDCEWKVHAKKLRGCPTFMVFMHCFQICIYLSTHMYFQIVYICLFLCIDYLFFFQIISISEGHTCASTSQVKDKEATKIWIADRAKEVLKSNPAMRAKKLKDQLEQQFPIKLSYNKVWEGRQRALVGLHGTWEDSFKMLWHFKAELEATCPGSIVEIACSKKKDGRVYFSRMFVAIKACVDGFLVGCRTYLGVDSTHLTVNTMDS